MTVHQENSAEFLFLESIQDVLEDRHVGCHSQTDRARIPSERRGNTVGENREDRNSEGLSGFDGDPLRQDAVRAEAEVGVLLRTAKRKNATIVCFQEFLHLHPILLGDPHVSMLLGKI